MSEPSLEALLAEHHIQHHALVLRSEDAFVAARNLRACATPGARVLVAQRPQRSVWHRLLAALGHGPRDLTVADELAGGLLCAGLARPALLVSTPELVAVAAEVPAVADPLDDVFAINARNL